MPRIRNEAPGAIHHVFARGVLRQRLFHDAEDYERYIKLLATVVKREGWLVLDFCLMPNHVHLLIETPEPNLGKGMQWLHSNYAGSFNDRYERRGEGHVFQGPYGNVRVEDDLHLMRVATYVAFNAVAAGLCRERSEWPWSAAGLLRVGSKPPWLAHDRLCNLLESMTGRSDFYERVIL